MRFLIALAIFLVAVVVGFGVGSFRSAGVSEFMHLATACEMVKIAKAKGYVTDAGRLADAVANAPQTDARLKDLVQQLKTAKNC